jgi:phosphate-selective porin OprO and OprP
VIRRLRLRFDGFVGDPRFLYAIQLSFAPGDVGPLRDGGNINIIRDAVLYYRPNRHWNIGFGQTKLPGNRQRVNSSGALQLTDRSINNALFTIDRDFGLQVYYLNENTDRFSYNIKTAISTGEGRNWTDQTDAHLAYTARLELMPLGTFQRSGMFFEGDLVREQSPKLLLGGTWHFNHQAKRAQGQLGSELPQPADLTSILLDAMLKYRGWSFQSAWMTRRTDLPVAVGGPPFVNAGSGYDLQLSYIFQNDIELIGRYSAQTPAQEVEAFLPQRDQYSAGITKYVWEHALKIQTELTYDSRSFPGTGSENGWYLRFQVELGI